MIWSCSCLQQEAAKEYLNILPKAPSKQFMFNPIEAITSEIFRHKEVMWLALVKILLSTGLEMMHHLIISSDCCKYMEEVQMVLSLSSSKDALTHVVSQVCRVNCHQYLPCQCRPSRKRRTTSHRYLSIVGHGFSSQRNIRNIQIYIHLHTYIIWFDQDLFQSWQLLFASFES